MTKWNPSSWRWFEAQQVAAGQGFEHSTEFRQRPEDEVGGDMEGEEQVVPRLVGELLQLGSRQLQLPPCGQQLLCLDELVNQEQGRASSRLHDQSPQVQLPCTAVRGKSKHLVHAVARALGDGCLHDPCGQSAGRGGLEAADLAQALLEERFSTERLTTLDPAPSPPATGPRAVTRF